MRNDDLSVLTDFLELPVESSEPILERFSSLSGAELRGSGLESFVYLPGSRADRVLLVAHSDTVHNNLFSQRAVGTAPIERNGVLYSGKTNRCLGADDRAGCAILWLLRASGHSLLVTDGEEQGNMGSNWLMSSNPDVAQEINETHQFMVEFDRRNGRDFKCYDVGTPEFRNYVSVITGYRDAGCDSSTDIRTLCRTVCGVNLSVGYRNEHSENEYLVISEWLHTLDVARRWLSAESLPKYPLPGRNALAG